MLESLRSATSTAMASSQAESIASSTGLASSSSVVGVLKKPRVVLAFILHLTTEDDLSIFL